MTLTRSVHRPWLRGAPAVVAALLLTACAGAASSSSPTPASSVTPASSPPTAAPAGPGTHVLTEASNDQLVRLHVGDRVQVVLSSTYWKIAGSSDPAVLRPAGDAAVSPAPGGCVPGQGCGTVTAAYDAIAPGRAQVMAGRTSCGEALVCNAAQSTYRVTVLVSA